METDLDAHLVHLGTMGVYGYSTVGAAIPEGYLTVGVETLDGEKVEQEILYPTRPGSIYHMTKSLDQILFQYYAQNDGLRITDLHQGIVWGTHTEQTRRHVQLINRFDYDGDYGTVLNRFLIQAAIGYPLTVHGTGGQTRAFIHIQDSVRCIDLALSDAPKRGDRVKIFNQMTETHRVRDLAEPRRRAHRRQDRLAPQPAQGSRRERPRGPERPAPRPRPRPDHPARRPPRGGGRGGEEIRLPRRPLPHPLRLRLDQGDRQDRRARPRAPQPEDRLTSSVSRATLAAMNQHAPTVRRPATYQDVLDAPEHMVAELIEGALHLHPRPPPATPAPARSLGVRIGGPSTAAAGGPGGWWILDEPELHLGADVLVPDLAGWRRERMPDVSRCAPGSTSPPDWVCEVLSPGTRADRPDRQAPHLRRGRRRHLWFVDPIARTLEAFALSRGAWTLIAALKDDEEVRVPPFDAISFPLSVLWPD